MTLLVRANALEKEEHKLFDHEVDAEVNTFNTIAAQRTTATSITFGHWGLSKNIDMQRRMRREILDMKEQTAGHDEVDYYGKNATPERIHQIFRCHPIAFHGYRDVAQDCLIPLSKPVELFSGQRVYELPISKSQKIWIDTSGYSRLPALFGSDADDLNTHRWLHATKNKMRSQGAGIYANLMTFGHGNDFCIDMLYLQFTLIFCIQCCLKGWRFTIWETRAVLIDRLSNFEFTLDEKLQA